MIRKTPGYGATGRSDAGLSGWKSGGTGREPLRHGYGLRSLLPGQTGNSLHNSGLNGAGGAAGERCNEKTAFVAPGNRKAEVCMRFFFFISGLAV
ncbi:hypothetical protein BJI68_06850 [Escherichia coli]|nr:hypothetical protein BBZ58_13410 [Escherichia coli]OIZ58711.1 hypothetical protein BJI68_06850 [Escherichia coli]